MLALLLLCVATGLAPRTAAGQNLPALPQVLLDTSYPSSSVTTHVPAGGDLQGALNRAQGGETITLDPGATYVGPVTLPAKPGSGWIIIRTAAPDNSLPPPGTRITPAYASVLPKVVTPSPGPAVETEAGAHHYRLTGLEITVTAAVTQNYGLVALGDGSAAQNALSQVPDHLVVDRVYVHGQPTANVRRGIALNSRSTAVIDSYISEIHEIAADSQAIGGWNGRRICFSQAPRGGWGCSWTVRLSSRACCSPACRMR